MECAAAWPLVRLIARLIRFRFTTEIQTVQEAAWGYCMVDYDVALPKEILMQVIQISFLQAPPASEIIRW